MITVLSFTRLKYRSPESYRSPCEISMGLMRSLDKIKCGIPTRSYLETDFIDLRRNLKRLISNIEKILYDSGVKQKSVEAISKKIDTLIDLMAGKEKKMSVMAQIKRSDSSVVTSYISDVYEFLDLFYDVLDQTNIAHVKEHKKTFAEVAGQMFHEYPKFIIDKDGDKNKIVEAA